MSSISSEIAVLPEVQTFNPLNESSAPSSNDIDAIKKPAPLGTAVEVQAVLSQPKAEPLPVINRGGYILTVPGAEDLEAPYIESVVSTQGRAATQLIEAISADAPVDTIRVPKKTLQFSVAAGALMLCACVYVLGFGGGDQKPQQIAASDRAVDQKVAAKPASSPSLVDNSKSRKPALAAKDFKPKRVKIKTIRVSKAPTEKVDVVSNGPVRSIAIIPSNKPAESVNQPFDQFEPSILEGTLDLSAPKKSLKGDKNASLIVVPKQKPEQTAQLETSDVTTGSVGTGTIGKQLAGLGDGSRQQPVTIVHIGDSHIASDSLTRGIRKGLQSIYGDAGRGAIIPANAYKYAHADGIRMKRTGAWSSVSSRNVKSGPYGISGVRVASSSPTATMTLSTSGVAFDWAEVTVLTGPKQGSVELLVDGATKVFNAKAATTGSKVVRLERPGRDFQVSPNGGGKTTILNWATGRETAGVRYVNFGINAATAYLPNHWNPKLVANDIRHLNPDMIVWGYGTNEGFNSNLNLASYREQVQKVYTTLNTAAPKADWLFVGPASGLARHGKAAGYCGNYRIPAKLGGVSETLKSFAAEKGHHFWDWSEAMGGPCAADEWAKASPRLAAGDRVHLTPRGYQKSADAFVAFIKKLVGKPQLVAAVGSQAPKL